MSPKRLVSSQYARLSSAVRESPIAAYAGQSDELSLPLPTKLRKKVARFPFSAGSCSIAEKIATTAMGMLGVPGHPASTRPL